jgi:hypothetical protein
MATSVSYHGNYSDRDQPTYNSVADYVTDARTLLQDLVPPYRYDDPSMLTALNAALLEASRIKPELFVYNFDVNGQAQSFEAVDDTYVAIEPKFRLALVHGLVGHALERDQEDYQDQRATAFLALFTQGLVGKALGAVVGGSPPKGKGGGA